MWRSSYDTFELYTVEIVCFGSTVEVKALCRFGLSRV